MADREETLTIKTKLDGTKEGADALDKLGDAGERLAKVGEQTTDSLSTTAQAIDLIAQAEGAAAGGASDLAGAMTQAGSAAESAGVQTLSAAQGSTLAVEGVTAAVERETQATEEAGRVAVESGADTERAAEKATSAIEKLTQEWQEEIAAAREAGKAFTADEVAAKVEQLSTAIRASSDDLKTQKAALEGVFAGLADELGKVKAASTGAGEETSGQAKKIEDAMSGVKARIAEVEAGLRGTGPAGVAGGEEASAAFLSVDAALKLANASAREASEKLEETGRLPKASIRELAEVIETVSIAMERAAGTSEAATAEQIANAEQLRAHLTGLTEITNRQTNASADNAVALQEQGNQVAQLTGALQGLVGTLGDSTTAYGGTISKIGGAARAYETAKDAIKALDLNTLGASKSTAALGLQVGAVIGVMIAAASAGVKLAGANKENAQATEDLSKSVRSTLPSWDDLMARSDGTQSALQSLIGIVNDRLPNALALLVDGFAKPSKAADELTDRTRSLIDTEKAFADQSEDLSDTILKLGVAMEHGREKADLFAIAQRAGFDANEAFDFAVNRTAQTLEFYRRTQEGGAAGQRLWDQAVRDSNGSAAQFAAQIPELTARLDEELRVTKLLTDAEKDNTAAKRANIDMTSLKADAVDRLMTKEEESLLRVSRANTAVETAVNGSTIAITQAVSTILAFLPAADENIVKLGELSSAIADVASKTDGMSAADRARIDTIVELTARADELTAAEARHLTELLKQITNGEKATEVNRARALSAEELAEALYGVHQAQLIGVESSNEQTSAAERELEIVRTLIEERKRQLGLTEEQIIATRYQTATLFELQARERALTAEIEPQLFVIKKATEAKAEEGDERERLSAIIEKEKASVTALGTAHSDLQKIVENGRVTWTNLTEAQRTNAEKGIEVVKATDEIKKSADGAADTLRLLGDTVIPNLNTRFDDLIAKGEQAIDMFERANEKIRAMNEAAEAAAADA